MVHLRLRKEEKEKTKSRRNLLQETKHIMIDSCSIMNSMEESVLIEELAGLFTYFSIRNRD